MEHEPFVEYVQKYFVDMKPTWHVDEAFVPNVDRSIAQYTGGMEQVKYNISLAFMIEMYNLMSSNVNCIK